MPGSGSAAFRSHDHGKCLAETRDAAARLADQKGLRLTPVRREVLEILLSEHRALGAYDVLDRLAAKGFARQPPVAYRALDFLVENGLAHRIRRLNAFVACAEPGHAHAPVFLICTSCGSVAEAPGTDVRARLDEVAAAQGFRIERSSIEAAGRCPACGEDAA